MAPSEPNVHQIGRIQLLASRVNQESRNEAVEIMDTLCSEDAHELIDLLLRNAEQLVAGMPDVVYVVDVYCYEISRFDTGFAQRFSFVDKELALRWANFKLRSIVDDRHIARADVEVKIDPEPESPFVFRGTISFGGVSTPGVMSTGVYVTESKLVAGTVQDG